LLSEQIYNFIIVNAVGGGVEFMILLEAEASLKGEFNSIE
jgi:hypothetical protein